MIEKTTIDVEYNGNHVVAAVSHGERVCVTKYPPEVENDETLRARVSAAVEELHLPESQLKATVWCR